MRLTYLVLAHLVAHIGALVLHIVVHLGHIRASGGTQANQGGVGDALFEDLPYFIFVGRLSLVVKFEFVLAAAHAEDFEAVNFGNEFGRTLRQKFRELLEENVGKACSEVGSIDVQLLLSWDVHILASWAVYLDP